MDRSSAVLQAERDLVSLCRKRDAVEASVTRMLTAKAEDQRELALQLSLDFPGVRSVGYLLGLDVNEQQARLALLKDDERAFIARLLQRIGENGSAYQALSQAMPYSFPLEQHGLDPNAYLRVGREAQRAQVNHHVRELLKSKSRRVEAIVACASPGNLVEQFSWQALDSLSRHNAARVLGVHVGFPKRLRTDPGTPVVPLREELLDSLRCLLGAKSGESTKNLLRRSTKGAQVLWLDFGLFGEKTESGALAKADLVEWLKLGQQLLCHDCPPEMRIVCYLALELVPEKLEPFAEFMRQQRNDLLTDQFRCSALPPLGRVELSDLVDFLSDPENTGCPPRLVEKAARLIMDQTGGDYAKTIALIKQAEEFTWVEMQRGIDQPKPGDPSLVETF